MAQLGHPYLTWTMWEMLRGEVRLTPRKQPHGLRGDLDRILVKRTMDYAIDAEAWGAPHEDWHEHREHGPAGAEIPALTVQCANEVNRSCDLLHCVPGDESSYYKRVGNSSVPEWSIKLHPQEVTRTGSDEGKPAWLTEWFINGPDTHCLFTRHVEWSARHSYNRTVSDESTGEFATDIEVGSMGQTCAVVALDSVKLIIYPVPKDIEPTWSRKLALEYRKEAGRIPDVDERKGIAHLLSFIVGRPLLNVGTTSFDDGARRIHDRACNPSSFNPRRLATQPSSEPLPVRRIENGIPDYFRDESGALIPKLETALEELLPRYLLARRMYGLDLAIERCLSVPELYFDVQLPLLRIVLETLANSWFRAQGKPSKTKWGIARKFRALLNELALPQARIEKRALKAASEGAHVKSLDTDEAIRQAIDETRAMQTLVNRVILKLLDYDGPFIDYSTLGFPERPSLEPLGAGK